MLGILCCLLCLSFLIAQHEERPLYHVHVVTSRWKCLHCIIRQLPNQTAGFGKENFQCKIKLVMEIEIGHHDKLNKITTFYFVKLYKKLH